jgi:acyl carrier protein
MNQAQGVVVRVIESLLAAADKSGVEVALDTAIHGEGGLELDSLQTAELSASLEDELGTDPFSAGEMPETVGEIVAFYAADTESGASVPA